VIGALACQLEIKKFKASLKIGVLVGNKTFKAFVEKKNSSGNMSEKNVT